MSDAAPGPVRKVLLASHHAERRGSAISLAELGSRLPARGFAPVFAFSKPGPLADDLAGRGFEVVQVQRQGLLRLGMIRQVIAMIRSRHIVLAHVNSAVPFAKYVAIAARLAGIPVVWHIREPLEDKRMHRQRRWVRALASRIVVLTRPQADFFAAPKKTTRIFNGVDVARFRCTEAGSARRALGYADDEFVFVQVGSIEANKGQSRSVQALAAILAEFPRARLLVVGPVVEAPEMQAIQSLLDASPQLRAAVRLYGESSDVRSLLCGCDCLLLPSLRESFPRTVMEGMAAGLPVIASRVGAVEDMTEHGVHGLQVPPGDVAALAAAMRAMAADGGRAAKRMGADNPAAAERLFDMASHVAAVTRLYDELLAGPK